MTPAGSTTRILAAVSLALLAAYAVVWSQLSPFDIGRSDFAAFYVGGTLLCEGHGSSLYDESLQAPLHAQLIAPDHERNLPYVDPPVAAALVLPVTVLGLDTAYRVWALVELAVLAGAIAIAAHAAPRGGRAAPGRPWASGLAALAGVGTLFAVAQAQWTPVLALGLAIAYWTWRRPQPAEEIRADAGTRVAWATRLAALGGAALVASALVGKPQLALGLVAFMLGWRRRGVLLGAAAGLAAAAAVSLALVGPAGIAGLARIVAGSTTRWDSHLMIGSSGVAAAVAGGGVAAVALASVLSLAACGSAYVLGARVRRDSGSFSIALAGAAVLSLLAAPHAYLDDLALLAPAGAWCLVASMSTAGNAAAGRRWVPWGVVLGLWGLINAAAVADLTAQGRLPSGPITAYALALTGAVALAATTGRETSRLGYRAADEAALGPVAHGVRHW